MLEREEQVDRQQVEGAINAEADQINSETEGSAENKQLQAVQQVQSQGGQALPPL
jgi:hypothetical protein|tara:strand:+ start:321 stop:485 length:165 start_codon:yes stop_codon:yes gene_type:complete